MKVRTGGSNLRLNMEIAIGLQRFVWENGIVEWKIIRHPHGRGEAFPFYGDWKVKGGNLLPICGNSTPF